MEIIVGDVYCEVIHPREHLKALQIIRGVCRARPEGYRFMPRYKRGLWDGYISLMGGFSIFPTGLFNRVNIALEDAGFNPILELRTSERILPPVAKFYIPENILSGVDLRDYQVKAVRTLLEYGRGIAKMATNSGKTEVMAAIIKALNFPRTLVLVHRKELLYQTAERFETRLGIECGRIGDSIKDYKQITVAMIQTLSTSWAGYPLQDNMLLMVDECHTASSDSYMDLLPHVAGPYRYGFSGTPLKHDVLSDMKLIAMTGEVVVEVTNKELIDAEYSAKPEIRIVRLYSRSPEKMKYVEAYDTLIIKNLHRNKQISKIAKEAGGTVLILVERLEHGEILRGMIDSAVFVNGGNSTEYRREVIEQMRIGRGIFIATPIFDEGVDIPALDCVILAGGGKSQVRLLQRIGRGLRRKEGENKLIVYDFDDNTNKYSLAHSKKRQQTYKQEQFDVRWI